MSPPTAATDTEEEEEEMLRRFLTKLASGERGQDMVEYAMITALISTAIVVASVGLIAPAFAAWATDLAACLGDAGSCPL